MSVCLLGEPQANRWIQIRATRSCRREKGLSFARGVGEAMDLLVNTFSQIVPNMLRHFKKGIHDLRIELAAGPALDLVTRSGKRLGGPVGTVRRDRIQSVGNREDA